MATSSGVMHLPRRPRPGWLLICAFALSGRALAAPPSLPAPCRSLIAESVPGWRMKEPAADAAAWARSHDLNPVVVSGDFDANGTMDWAALGTTPSGVHIAVCFSHAGRRSLKILNHDGCSDLIVRHRKGSVVHNYDRDRNVRLRRDGIGAYCFEKAGQLITYEHGGFSVFTHSD